MANTKKQTLSILKNKSEKKSIALVDVTDNYDEDYDEYISLHKKEVKDDSSAIDILQLQDEIDIEEENKITKHSSSSSKAGSGLPENSFFYTNDKFFSLFEDEEMTKYILIKYPTFDVNVSDDTIMRKTIIEILNDVRYMNKLLDRYNINVYDFFKFLFRLDPNIFKGLFLKRIRKALKYKKYAVSVKKLSYSERKKASRKKKRLCMQ